jgi:murein DD-endopeptidase MepM/ murein hydrolase activator NlpD
VAAGLCQYGNEQCLSDPDHLAVDVVPVAPGELSQIQHNRNAFAGTPIYAPFDGTLVTGYSSSYQEFALDLDAPLSGIRIIFSHACPTTTGRVLAGQEIGELAYLDGTTGQICTDGLLGIDSFAHLHFEVQRRDGGKFVRIPPHDYLR